MKEKKSSKSDLLCLECCWTTEVVHYTIEEGGGGGFNNGTAKDGHLF